jgi:hypothetical protein
MTKQEQFNKVYSHFILKDNPFSIAKKTQGEDKGRFACVYRGGDGRRCAAGIFVPKKDYHRIKEGISVWADANDTYFKSKGFDTDFLASLQVAHDDSAIDMQGRARSNAAGKRLMLGELEIIAEQNGLTIPNK